MKKVLWAVTLGVGLSGGSMVYAQKTDSKSKQAETKAPVEAKKPGDVKAEPAKIMMPVVELKTSEGVIKIELDEKNAPVSTKNFLQYVNDKFYDGTIFHRVIDGFMIQGGGFELKGGKLEEKKTRSAIANEAKNGLKNDRGTIAMARTADPNSATAQFYLNLVNNNGLNHPAPDGHGYAVFGKVIGGMEVVDKIGKVKTTMKDGMMDVPEAEVKILSAVIVNSKLN